jgi:probable HAF family extracellular repeat protein
VFFWQYGVMTDLGTLGGQSASLPQEGMTSCAINRSGEIAGNSETADGSWHGFLWHTGVITDLGTLGGDYAGVSAISNSGEIVGESLTADGSQHAFAWKKGVMVDLGTLPGGTTSSACAINDHGQIAGFSDTAGGSWHGFIWQKGVMTDLGTLGGTWTVPYAINDWGQVVGQSGAPDESEHAFLWQSGAIVDLNPSGTPGGSDAYGISNSGRIVGYYSGGGCMWTVPVPGPVTTVSLSGPAGANGWYTGCVEVTLAATESGNPSAGITTYYCLNGRHQHVYTRPLSLTRDGVHTLSYWSVDRAGNAEKARSATIKIDTTPPLVTVGASPTTLSPADGRTVNVVISGSVSDAVSGVDPAGASFCVEDDYGIVNLSGPVAIGANGAVAFSVPLVASVRSQDRQDRQYRITVRAHDMAGNSGSACVVVTVPHSTR